MAERGAGRARGGPGRTVEVEAGPVAGLDVDVVAVPVPADAELRGAAAGLDERVGGAISRCLDQGAFRAEEDESAFFPVGDRTLPHILAVGTGDGDVDAGRIRRVAGRAVREARTRRARSVAVSLPPPAGGTGERWPEAAAQGLVLGDWAFEDLKGRDEDDPAPSPPGRAVVHFDRAVPGARAAAERGRRAAEAQNWARGLVARPGNIATPAYLAARAEELADDFGLGVQVWGPEKLRSQGFGGLLAVARGSDEEPRFVILRHEGADEPPFVLAGKGVTFDSGGISLKPSEGMGEMKYDMAGAAAVMGALRAAADLELPRRIVGLIPATENLPSGSALKPGDVIRGVSNTSIEVVNTDAEGRLILSDTLAWASRLGPRAVVDVATLTGACVVALGHHAVGLMTEDETLADELREAGRASGERTWRLPLWDEYRGQLDSEIADIKNAGGRAAGAVTAGMFLREFVGDRPWAHLDIAGTAWAEEEGPCQPEGATGVGVRLLVEWLRGRA